MIKKVIDLTSSYGVVMGTDAKKLRKCFDKFWKENAAARSNFIQENSNPVKVRVFIKIFVTIYHFIFLVMSNSGPSQV